MRNISWNELASAYSMLRQMHDCLTDWMQCSLDEWYEAVREVNQERKAGNEISQGEINNLADWLDEICLDDGMPSPFGDKEAA